MVVTCPECSGDLKWCDDCGGYHHEADFDKEHNAGMLFSFEDGSLTRLNIEWFNVKISYEVTVRVKDEEVAENQAWEDMNNLAEYDDYTIEVTKTNSPFFKREG